MIAIMKPTPARQFAAALSAQGHAAFASRLALDPTSLSALSAEATDETRAEELGLRAAEHPRILSCRDGCGATAEAASDAEAERLGWRLLAVAGGWRCGSCVGELLRAGQILGNSAPSEDVLPPTSRGALPKETASTITPPARLA